MLSGVFPPMHTLWALVDLDGSLADCSARLPLEQAARAEPDPRERGKLWDRYHAGCGDDPPNMGEVLLIRSWHLCGGRVVYLTGRPDRFRPETQGWLKGLDLPETPLFMRSEGNYTSTVDYKRRTFELIKSMMVPGDRFAFALEDHDRVVEYWRTIGLTCLQPRTTGHK